MFVHALPKDNFLKTPTNNGAFFKNSPGIQIKTLLISFWTL